MKKANTAWSRFQQINEAESEFPFDMIYNIKFFKKDTLIFRLGEICNALNIMTKGSVKTEMITPVPSDIFIFAGHLALVDGTR